MTRLLFLFALLIAPLLAHADPLKILNADHEQRYLDAEGAGSSVDPHILGVSLPGLVETSAGGNQALKVFIQDQTTESFDLFFHRELQEGQHTSQFEILGDAVDVITDDNLIDHVYTTAAVIQRSSTNMNVDGSVTPVIFQIDPQGTQAWDVTRVILVIEDSSSMDFSQFGSLAPLTNGVLLRVTNGESHNLFSWKTNGDIINRCFDHSFQQNSGQNFRGFTVRCTYGGQSKRGVTLRLLGIDSDEAQVIIRDDLTGLSKVRLIAQGHAVQ